MELSEWASDWVEKKKTLWREACLCVAGWGKGARNGEQAKNKFTMPA